MSSFGNSTSYWNFGEDREDPIHRIHSYPAKFPAFITTKALRYAEQQGVNVRVVADVFCGCGTTAVEAKRNGKNFWGCDINPVAVLIAQVKTHHYQDAVLARHFDAIKDEFRRVEPTQEEHVRISDRMRYWFEERNIEDLIRLDQAIRQQTPARSAYRKFFLCGFSNILKPTSRWLTKSIKAQLDPHKSPSRVMEAFEEQFALMRNANQQNCFPTPRPASPHPDAEFSGVDGAGLEGRSDRHQPAVRHFIRLCEYPSAFDTVAALCIRLSRATKKHARQPVRRGTAQTRRG